VIKICRDVGPWRICVAWRAFAAIELPSHPSVPSLDLAPGDLVEIAPRADSSLAST
jgi:hypothetical protein